MKRMIFATVAAAALLTGCYSKDVEVTMPVGDMTLTIRSYGYENNADNDYIDSADSGEHLYYANGRVCEIAVDYFWPTDSTSLPAYYDHFKQMLLPNYEAEVVGRQEKELTTADRLALVHAMEENKLIVLDTVDVPVYILSVTDAEKYAKHLDDWGVSFSFEWYKAYANAMGFAVEMGEGLDAERMHVYKPTWLDNIKRWGEHLDSIGVGLQPDPQGRTERMVCVQRHKGKV